jgi:rhamnose transport system ATP-binding protein
VRTRSNAAAVNTLSGGNQQKVLFAKWLFRRPKVFMLDEPTRGVDVGAKLAIYNLIHALAAQGMAVLLISSEHEEVLGLAHRVLVMRAGRIVAEFDQHAMSEEAVLHAAFATAPEEAA